MSLLAHILNIVFKRMPIRTIEEERRINAERRPPKVPDGVEVGSENFGGVPCELEVKHKMIHAYPVITQLKEARQTLNSAQEFLKHESNRA